MPFIWEFETTFTKSGSSKALIGMSGGIDSAVVAALLAKAIGPANILGISLPTQFTSS